jgi:hypothetical protein
MMVALDAPINEWSFSPWVFAGRGVERRVEPLPGAGEMPPRVARALGAQ